MPFVLAPRVFLSYARQDGEEFAAALRQRLVVEEPEITVWQDRTQLEGGIGWWTQIETALDQVQFLVIVMTPQAVASETTRKEWRYARSRGVAVYPVKGVPDEQLDYARMPNWMRKSHLFDIGQVADGQWRDTKEWQTFVNYLKSDRPPARVPFMAPDLPSGIVPRTREYEQLLRLVLHRTEQPIAITTALHGAGGYGKTTLAVCLCHDERVIEAFDDGVLWTSLGPSPRVIDELAKLYSALTGQHPAFVDVTHAAVSLAARLEHRDCLLVIDDVWDRADLEPFLRGASKCARVVTTRRFDLVNDAPRVRVDEMSTAESIRVLRTAFQSDLISDASLEPLVTRLGDWPLLLRLAASMIRRRLDRGDSSDGALAYAVRALDKRGVTAFDPTKAAQREEAVRRTVAASQDQLSTEDRRRFQELAVFPVEASVPLTTLERLWALDDLDTADCAQRLDDVALLSLDLRRGVVTIHAVMRSYLLQELDDVRQVHARLVASYEDQMRLPDTYAWRWLPHHLSHAGEIDNLRNLLLRPEWLLAKLRAVGAYALIGDFDLVRGDRALETIQAALRLALPALVADPTQLAEQLLGRLPARDDDTVEIFNRELRRVAPRPRLGARWPNLEEPGGELIQTLSRHDGEVNGAIAFGDANVLSWSTDATIRVWNVATGEGRALVGHQGSIRGALLMAHEQGLSWSDDGTLRLWDLATGNGQSFIGHENSVHGALLLPDGRPLSWSDDYTLRVWLITGDSRTLVGHKSLVRGALPLPNGRALSWSADGTLRSWDLTDGTGRAFVGHEGSARGALLLAPASALSWSGDGTLRVWDLLTGDSRALTGHESGVEGVLLLPDQRALSWSGDGTLRLWNIATGECQILTGHEDSVRGTVLVPDGRALSWSDDGTLRLWDLSTGEHRTLRGHESAVHGAAAWPQNRALSWGTDGALRLWSLTALEGRSLTGHEGSVRGVLRLDNGHALSWSVDGTLRVWDTEREQGRALNGHQTRVGGALLFAEDRALSWSADRTLRVWNRETGKSSTLSGHVAAVRGALLLDDGTPVSWGDDGTLRVWDVATGEGQSLGGYERSVRGALPIPQRRVLSWSDDGTVRLWDVTTATSRAVIGERVWLRGAVLSRGNRVLVWSDDGTLRLWDLVTDEARELVGDEQSVRDAILLSDSNALAWSDRQLWIWYLATGDGYAVGDQTAPIVGALPLSGLRALSWAPRRDTDDLGHSWRSEANFDWPHRTDFGRVEGVRYVCRLME